MGHTSSTPEAALVPQYLPASVKLPTFGQDDVLDKLEGKGVRYIRFQWVDYTNITRYRVIPLAVFCKLLSAPRPGIAISKAVFGIIGSSLAPGFSGTGEYLYIPDLNSTRLCGYAPGHASLMGWFEEKLPILENGETENVSKMPLCPRGILKDIVKCVSLETITLIFITSDLSKGKVLGVEFLVGVETEFVLLKSMHPMEAVSNAPWSASRALPSGSVAAKCLEDIADALQNSEIELLMYHAEAAPGQVWYYTIYCWHAFDKNSHDR
jgi:glutamine synthetase